ncbi:MAG: hypothetical protein BroJett030_06240 [Alphaproteobacteria bacterium]|nr:MAG: hypothetical protein BroJett030_06240 [Alphaproteobacteria bacterium]
MTALLLQALGGVGLFLLGITLLTEGMRGLAGTALRNFLRRYTRSPASGAVTGALATATIQSSSAIIVATVGFVGAGLMTFGQALGIIFGANIGTTITGWLVAIVGFKLQLGAILLPFVLVGVLMRLFGAGKWRSAGWALTGFCLLFVGIGAMQQGMAHLQGVFSLDGFSADTLTGRLQLVGIGLAVTVVTQSSSAGVAIALAAIGAGAIDFSQAAALVIGMDIGTTSTAALATIGGSTAMRRTGLAHVIYNLMTGTAAFFLLGPLTTAVAATSAAAGLGDDQINLVAFHTTFNMLGVAVILFFTRPFADVVIWLVPERGPRLTARLDERLHVDPAAAADAIGATIDEIARFLFAVLADQLSGVSQLHAERRLATAAGAIDETRQFAERVRTDQAQAMARRRHLAALHALDHLVRLRNRCTQGARVQTVLADPGLRRSGDEMAAILRAIIDGSLSDDAEARLDALRHRLRDARHEAREETIAAAASGAMATSDAMLRLDAIRWLHRVAYHLWRIVHHQRAARSEAPPPVQAADPFPAPPEAPPAGG